MMISLLFFKLIIYLALGVVIVAPIAMAYLWFKERQEGKLW